MVSQAEPTTVQRFPTIPSLNPHSAKLVEWLRDGKPGDQRTDDEIAQQIGMSAKPKGPGYRFLATAIRRCMNEHSVVWHRIPGASVIRCLDPKGIIELAKDRNRHIGRTAGRANREIGTVTDTSGMPDRDKTELLTMAAQMSLIRGASSAYTRKVLETRGPDALAKAGDIQRKALEAMK